MLTRHWRVPEPLKTDSHDVPDWPLRNDRNALVLKLHTLSPRSALVFSAQPKQCNFKTR